MQINTNITSLNAQRSLTRAGEDMAVHLQRMSSGQRINSARDDAAGTSVSSRMTAQINGLRRANQNINDGISLLQVADGAAGQLNDNYQRMRELAVQAANDTNSKLDRTAIQNEVNALVLANADIVDAARFNNERLLDGSFTQQLQVGAASGQTMQLAIPRAVITAGYSTGMVDVAPQQSTAVGGAVLGAIGRGDLVINNAAVGASVAGAQVGQAAGSAYAVAAAINAAGIHNISATANNTIDGAVSIGGVLAGAAFSINGVDVGAIGGGTAAVRAANAAGAISATAGASGVTASASGSTLTLTAVDGRDIVLSEAVAGALGSVGLSGGSHKGTVTVNEAPRPGAHTMKISGNNPAQAGLSAGKLASVSIGAPDYQSREIYTPGEPPMDLSTYSGANDALDYLDGKINQVSEIRGQLGATSNRLTAAASNAGNAADNLSSARSRILDADYADETAQLTRTRILREAGASMVAQANVLPQQALLLLR
ncbi:flagellin [Duganella sp. CF402]|uniref:flagellin N-terminal helical domain-containing protein n=1 Tax=unclassified Duganella TaxID=2636909 RepID=UPI0008CFEE2D|nr:MULTISPECIES: flagellin [unclassified Duganella]RZT08107.1 flagellin [Duganella sp. BK701]SEM05382.1 flagellin [Duganella sp. CF402]